MAHPVQGHFLPLLLAVCCLLLLQVSECSTPPSPPPPPADRLDDALHHQLLMVDAEQPRTARAPTCSTEVAGDGRTGGAAAAPSSASATPARAVGAVVASSPPRQTSDGALLVRAGTMPLRSKLARRVLAGAGVDGVSCGSFNPHARCPPAGKP